ncbi:hypothetical protein Xinn_04058 [Xenorhabdus innexi]|uniref:Uncharacterized protein n=1 Tax=Xenorhabdus innexi TaxID=290109 RepID=A0A2G0MRC8_9GAMM|nr:hypothetical protein Xinn_04058 [Xenorhabdus innexi]
MKSRMKKIMRNIMKQDYLETIRLIFAFIVLFTIFSHLWFFFLCLQ